MPDKSIRLMVPIVVISGVAAVATGAELLYGHPATPPAHSAPLPSTHPPRRSRSRSGSYASTTA